MSGMVAIHQPNFFPWLGYFDKIRRADTFIFLDQVDYPRKGSGGMGSWTNRVALSIQGEPRWVTCPVHRAPLGSPIDSVAIDDRQPWRGKLIKTLEANYARAPNFKATLSLLEPLICSDETSLAAFNIAAIRSIAAQLGVSARFVRQGELDHHGSATSLLIALAKACGARSYLAGGGASGYQQDDLFHESGIELVLQQFTPKPYGDPARWRPGLSVIDYLMQDGRPLDDVL